jgi:ATP-dependent protease ClpP protease subunit
MSKTIIALNGVVGWDILAEDINKQIDDADGDIIFEMNSGGGYITEGVSILNKIRSYNKGKTEARISYSASMMTQIALACDEVNVYDNAIFMIHNAQGGAWGDHNEMEARARHLKAMSQMLAKVYVNKTGKTSEEIHKMMDETTYMFGEEIVTEGFADSIIDTDGEKDQALAVEAAGLNFSKSMDAMKEEGLTASQLADELKMCEKGCALASMPSSEKIENSNKGSTVKKTSEELLQELNAANAEIDSFKTQMTAKDGEITALKDELETLKADSETSLAVAKQELQANFEGIMAMALEVKAPKDVALSMAKAANIEEAQVVCAKAMTSNGVTFGGEQKDPSSNVENHGWGNYMNGGKK